MSAGLKCALKSYKLSELSVSEVDNLKARPRIDFSSIFSVVSYLSPLKKWTVIIEECCVCYINFNPSNNLSGPTYCWWCSHSGWWCSERVSLFIDCSWAYSLCFSPIFPVQILAMSLLGITVSRQIYCQIWQSQLGSSGWRCCRFTRSRGTHEILREDFLNKQTSFGNKDIFFFYITAIDLIDIGARLFVCFELHFITIFVIAAWSSY